MKSDSELITYFGNTRNLKKSTLDSYRIYIKEYAAYNDMTMVELLDEAEREEEEGKRWKYRSLEKDFLASGHIYTKNTHTPQPKADSANCLHSTGILKLKSAHYHQSATKTLMMW